MHMYQHRETWIARVMGILCCSIAVWNKGEACERSVVPTYEL